VGLASGEGPVSARIPSLYMEEEIALLWGQHSKLRNVTHILVLLMVVTAYGRSLLDAQCLAVMAQEREIEVVLIRPLNTEGEIVHI